MAFYDPDNFTLLSDIDREKNARILQPLWEFIKDGREDILRSALFPPFLATSFYFVVVGFFTFLDLGCKNWAWLQQYKIQKDKEVTWALVKHAIFNHFWNLVLWIIPMAFVQLIWVPPSPLPPVAPTLWQFVWQQALFFVIFDLQYWAFHSLHHKVRFLYRWCHSVHHQFHSTFAFTTQHLHPWELLWVGTVLTTTPWLFKPHILTYWSWFLLATYVSIEAHMGYDFPFAAQHWLPLYGGALKHDMHHMRPMSNFQPWLNYIDVWCGWYLDKKKLEETKVKRNAAIGLHNAVDDIGIQKMN